MTEESMLIPGGLIPGGHVREEAEARVLEAARTFVVARQSFNRMRTSKRFNGREIAIARTRRDSAVDALVDAVEGLDP